MASKSKKSRASGRFGARYGKKIRDKLVQVEDKQRKKSLNRKNGTSQKTKSA